MDKQMKLVAAIEEGKIVNVPEEYAIKEGLPILRKSPIGEVKKEAGVEKSFNALDLRGIDRKEIFGLHFRRPWKKKNDVIDALLDNFQWEITAKRRHLGITRKKLADVIGASEENVKMIENGILPSDDFILISKIQNYLGINLRKDRQEFEKSLMQQAVESKVGNYSLKDEDKKRGENRRIKSEMNKENKPNRNESRENILGDEIEIIE